MLADSKDVRESPCTFEDFPTDQVQNKCPDVECYDEADKCLEQIFLWELDMYHYQFFNS